MRKSLADPALKVQRDAYEQAVQRSNDAKEKSLADVAHYMVDLFEAAGFEMNDMGELLASVGASDSMATAAYREWDDRHPGAARQALEDLLTGAWPK